MKSKCSRFSNCAFFLRQIVVAGFVLAIVSGCSQKNHGLSGILKVERSFSMPMTEGSCKNGPNTKSKGCLVRKVQIEPGAHAVVLNKRGSLVSLHIQNVQNSGNALWIYDEGFRELMTGSELENLSFQKEVSFENVALFQLFVEASATSRFLGFEQESMACMLPSQGGMGRQSQLFTKYERTWILNVQFRQPGFSQESLESQRLGQIDFPEVRNSKRYFSQSGPCI